MGGPRENRLKLSGPHAQELPPFKMPFLGQARKLNHIGVQRNSMPPDGLLFFLTLTLLLINPAMGYNTIILLLLLLLCVL